MNSREHARLARELIDACGGLDEAVRNCRVSKSVLSGYQNPHHPSTMPADIIACLESYCGRAIYSAALFDQIEAAKPAGNLRDLVCQLSEASVDLQRRVREALGDERLTPRELDIIAAAEREAEQALDNVKAARREAEEGRGLRAVG